MTRSISSLIVLCSTCAALSGCTDTVTRNLNEMQAKLKALPPQCAIGDATAVPGSWIAAPRAAPVPNVPAAMLFTFDAPIRTHAFRVALNRSALHNLDKVESRDAQGNWSIAWTGTQADAPAGCDVVQLAQTFASSERDVAALRVTLRTAGASVTMNVADVSALKAD